MCVWSRLLTLAAAATAATTSTAVASQENPAGSPAFEDGRSVP